MTKRLFAVFCLCLLSVAALSACASAPEDIPASSVSSLQYQQYNCRQIAAELDRVEKKANDLYYRLDKKASNDSAQMAVGMILFWPTLFFLEGGDGPEAAEYGQLKGQLEALETASTRRQCGLTFPKGDPAPQPKKSAEKDDTKAKANFRE